MKRLNLFLLLISLYVGVANACIDEHDTHYYMFSVFHQNALMDKNVPLNVRFWSKYTGGHVSDKEILAQLNNINSTMFDDTRLSEYLKGKKDNNGLEYLKQLSIMKKAASINQNSWSYPTKAELAANKKIWEECMDWALNKLQGKNCPLYNRYILMAMRGAFYSGARTKMAEIWTQYGPKVKEQDIKNQCEGYMANEWLKNGLTEKAREFYVKNGNISDLRATFPRVITIKDIKELFSKMPNSVAFPFLLQDYLNGMDSDVHPRYDNLSFRGKEYQTKADRDSATKAELLEFAEFASKVAAGDQTKLPSLWKSAEGYAKYLTGNCADAQTAYYAALKMKAPQRVAFNTRVLILLAKAESSEYNDKFDTYVGKEMNWLVNTAKKEKPFNIYTNRYFRNHYTDVIEHVVADYLAPKYVEAGKISMAAVLCGLTDEITTTQHIENRRCKLLKRDSTKKGFNGDYSGYLFALLDTTTTDGVISYYTVLKGGGTQTEQTLAQFNNNDLNYVEEIIATKLMREFKFKSAIEFLKKLPATFVQDQNIYKYLPYSYKTPIWLGYKQTVDAKMKKKSASAKIDFCKYMLKLEANFEKAQKKAKEVDPKLANTAYALATAYAQATYCGRCWALTNYAKSSVLDSVKIAKDPYIRRSQALLRSAYKADTSTANQVRCLAGLSFLGKKQECYHNGQQTYIVENDLDKYYRLLIRYENTQAYEDNRLTTCDILKDYLSTQNQ